MIAEECDYFAFPSRQTIWVRSGRHWIRSREQSSPKRFRQLLLVLKKISIAVKCIFELLLLLLLRG